MKDKWIKIWKITDAVLLALFYVIIVINLLIYYPITKSDLQNEPLNTILHYSNLEGNDYVITDEYEKALTHFYLLKNSSGTYYVITVDKYLFFEKYSIGCVQQVTNNETFEYQDYINSFLITIEDDKLNVISYGYLSASLAVFSAGFIAIHILFIYHVIYINLVKRRRFKKSNKS